MKSSYNLGKIQKLLENENWDWASTCEYIMNLDCKMSKSDFKMIIDLIAESDREELFDHHFYPCIVVGDYMYWAKTRCDFIIERQIVLPEIETLPNLTIPDDSVPPGVVSHLEFIFGDYWRRRQVFEFSCGWGWSVENLFFDLKKYTGIDRNPQNITLFKKKYPYSHNCIYAMLFEESTSLWKFGNAIIIGTFGAASYLKESSLKLLKDSGKDYFIMFYNEDDYPNSNEPGNYYHYSINDIKPLLPSSQILPFCNYYIVSNKDLHTHEIKRITDWELSHLNSLFKPASRDLSIPYDTLFTCQMRGIMEDGNSELNKYSSYIDYSNIKLDFASIATQYEEYIAKHEAIVPFIEEWHKEDFEIIKTIISERVTFFRNLYNQRIIK